MAASEGALAGVRILDLTDERGIYGVKLLADLGADVVRPEPPGGDALRARGPFIDASASSDARASLWHAYFASNRRFFTIDLESDQGREQLSRLVDSAEIVVTCAGAFAVAAADLDAKRAQRPDLVVIETSSFGPDGPWADYLAPDLVAGALGGSGATTGDVETPPLKLFGELNFMVSGAYTAVAALSALHHLRKTGEGQRADVSAHECIASCLEHVLMWYWYSHQRPMRPHPALERRGSLHWSNAYVVMQAKGGSIMVTPTPSVDTQIAWLIEEDAHGDIIDPKYQEPELLPTYISRLMELLRDWVATKDVEELFHEAQARHCPFGWVLPIERVADNPQLEARDWWVPYRVGGTELKGPGTPYHFSETPWRMGEHGGPGADTDAVLADINWSADRPAAAAPTVTGGGDRPLEGLRVLDFSHVLAGPFATRLLADMGADVVRVNSAERATGANMPGSAYYAMWNRNKRSLALDMSRDESKPIARRLVEQADIVIDNFSVGVLDRWGIGYETTSAAHPGVIYVEMSGMGDTGPWSNFVTFAPTIHALSGMTHLTGVPGREDIGIGFSYNDHQAGLHGAVAILAALEARRRTGKGQRVDISQYEIGVNFSGPSLMDYFANGVAARPTGNNLPYDVAAPHGCYPCAGAASDEVADERWVAIACMQDSQWQSLKELMGNPDWATAETLATAEGRVASIDSLDERIAEWTRGLDAVEVMERCQAVGVPAGVVQNSIDLIEHDPQLRHSGFLNAMPDAPPAGPANYDRLAIRFSKTRCEQYRPVSELGQDNATVLADWIGMSEEEVEQGEASGYLA